MNRKWSSGIGSERVREEKKERETQRVGTQRERE